MCVWEHYGGCRDAVAGETIRNGQHSSDKLHSFDGPQHQKYAGLLVQFSLFRRQDLKSILVTQSPREMKLISINNWISNWQKAVPVHPKQNKSRNVFSNQSEHFFSCLTHFSFQTCRVYNIGGTFEEIIPTGQYKNFVKLKRHNMNWEYPSMLDIRLCSILLLCGSPEFPPLLGRNSHKQERRFWFLTKAVKWR